ncbi:hypothetical protein NNJEOMEG_00140 [Fundidesulfovibrio magnetotacticus]|uniref:Uncharacterized protein n=1 Tax=Fundidesulfovibrio magnetotacticus TaxID=2730080 RepID=A0A6V8LRB7_9BACT|nr:hypothetical protein NNJEOMEG_00140 [Fundidesulfovibrio magnetotacticus]
MAYRQGDGFRVERPRKDGGNPAHFREAEAFGQRAEHHDFAAGRKLMAEFGQGAQLARRGGGGVENHDTGPGIPQGLAQRGQGVVQGRIRVVPGDASQENVAAHEVRGKHGHMGRPGHRGACVHCVVGSGRAAPSGVKARPGFAS